jgi:hypothetical protein
MAMPSNKNQILEMKLTNLIKKVLKEESPWKYKDEEGNPTNFPPGYKQKLKQLAMKVAKQVGVLINKEAEMLVKSNRDYQNLYTEQGMLEEVIKILEENV